MKKRFIIGMLLVCLLLAALPLTALAANTPSFSALAFYLRKAPDPVTPGGSSAAFSDTGSGTHTCTVEIRCDTILSNLDKLEEGKAPYVPANGVILEESTVSFESGETAFDILKRVCENAQLQLEYSWNTFYDSYYVEGINHLYEFDCGAQSGWMYRINDGFPNYGSSSYKVQDGDRILWVYTCAGLGTDVGAPRE